MNELPRTLLEAVHYFADPAICNAFMRDVKWPDGKPVCPRCGDESISDVKNRPKLQCNKCRCQFSLRDGTIFSDSAVPIGKWFSVIWCESQKIRISTEKLAAAIGVTQMTAWHMRARIRATLALYLLDGEEWRPVVGYEGLYEVSNLGRVRGLPRPRKSRSGRIAVTGLQLIQASQVPPPNEHCVVALASDGTRKSHWLHLLVMNAFVGPIPAGMECRHRDGNPTNNRLDNLIYGTPLQNADDRNRHGRTARGEKNGSATITEAVAREIKSRPGGYGTGKALAKEFGVSEAIISQIRKGKTWSHLE